MKVYVINEYRNCGEKIIWGVFSSKENAIKYLKFMNWNNDDDFGIFEYEVDKKIERYNL